MSKGVTHIVIAVSVFLLSFVIFMLSITGTLPSLLAFIWWITTPIIVTCAAYAVYYAVVFMTNKELKYLVPIVCLGIAIVSAIIGVILYVTDDNFILRGLDAELIWFFGSIPSLLTAIVHFIINSIRTSKELRELKEQSKE